MENIFNSLNINNGDKILVSSDILRLLIKLGKEKLYNTYVTI